MHTLMKSVAAFCSFSVSCQRCLFMNGLKVIFSFSFFFEIQFISPSQFKTTTT